MSETHEAQLLAHWLEGDPGSSAPTPGALDAAVVETVYALRPDRAPAHRVTLDDILDAVDEGPFGRTETTQDREQSTALAHFLDRQATGESHPEPESTEAVYALCPDRAPAHRVTLDDIFDAVDEGPFAQPTTLQERREGEAG